MNYRKHKFTYLSVTVAAASLFFILRGPFYEALTDISVTPPENIRKTDFSWITVNEWFNGQIYLIKSHEVLKNVRSEFEEEQLKRMISARRMGSADIIRISARSNGSIKTLIGLVTDISNEYLNIVNKVAEPQSNITDKALNAERANVNADKAVEEDEIKKMELLRSNISKEADILTKGLAQKEQDLSFTNPELKKSQDAVLKLSSIDIEISRDSEELEQLRKVYTDNWPEASGLIAKLKVLKDQRSALIPEVKNSKYMEDKSIKLAADIEFNKKSLERMRSEIEKFDALISEAQKAHKTEKSPSAVEHPAVNKTDYGQAIIINLPTANFLPDLGMQLLYGLITGFLVWFLIGLFFSRESAAV